jgi:hypothetical protein
MKCGRLVKDRKSVAAGKIADGFPTDTQMHMPPASPRSSTVTSGRSWRRGLPPLRPVVASAERERARRNREDARVRPGRGVTHPVMLCALCPTSLLLNDMAGVVLAGLLATLVVGCA